MRFAFSLMCTSLRPEDDAWMIENEVELGLLADELGFDLVMTGERHFSGTGGGNPLQALSALAPRLRRAWVGTGILVLPDNHPVRLAEQLNILDQLTKGRCLFGLGSGMSPEDAGAFGLDVLKMNNVVYEEVRDTLLALWEKKTEDPPLDFHGTHYSGTLYDRICPTSYRRPHPHLKVSATTEPQLDFAARKGWAIFLTGRNASDVRPFWESYQRKLVEYGHSDEVIAHCVEWSSIAKPAMHIADTPDQAWTEWNEFHDALLPMLDRKAGYADAVKRKQGWTGALPNVPDRGEAFRRRVAVYGDTATIREHVADHQSIGLNLFHLSMFPPTSPRHLEIIKHALHLFADEVMPHFREAPSEHAERVPA